MKRKILIIVFICFSLFAFGQKKLDTLSKIAFVYYENRKANFIAIPNTGKFYSFKIYRKTKDDTLFVQVVEKKKPPLPMRYNITPYGITWVDKEYHTREVDYKITAFDKKGNEICKMYVMWENDSSKEIPKNEN
jgi:hypothetical protein